MLIFEYIFYDFQNKLLAVFFEDFGTFFWGFLEDFGTFFWGFLEDFGTVTFFLNGNVYNGVFVRNSRGPDTQRVLGTQKASHKSMSRRSSLIEVTSTVFDIWG